MFISAQRYSPNFRAAQLNIAATSDNHGNLLTYPILAETVKNNKKEIFVKSDEPSTLNVLAIVGDWFMNPSKRGFITNKEDKNGDLQAKFLNKFIDYVHTQSGGQNSNFETVFVLGNHDLDAGDKFMYKVMDSEKMKTLVTNADVDNSPKLKSLMEKNPNVVQAQVFVIPDDKNPELEHKVLFIGATIPSMKFYNPGLLKDLKFFDDCNKKDANLKKEDLQKTIASIHKEVKTFKEENPKGAVVLLSHMGNPISKMVRDEVPGIDVILNGHDHKNLITIRNSTNINSLGKDNEIIQSLNLRFDDDGNLEKDINTYYTKTTSKVDLAQNPVQQLANEILNEDLCPLVRLTDIFGKKEEELPYSEDIRYKNSYLANWLTSAIKYPLRERCNDNEVIVGVQSSIIRGGLKNGSNNLDIMKVFDGVSEDLSNIRIGEVSGEELVGLITENIEGNLDAPKRNTIIQWSDIQVNRTLIADILADKSKKSFADAIKVRNDMNEFEPIDLEKDYKIAIGEKFLVKDDIKWPGKIRDRFVSLNVTYDQLLRSYIASPTVGYQLKVTQETKEDRII